MLPIRSTKVQIHIWGLAPAVDASLLGQYARTRRRDTAESERRPGRLFSPLPSDNRMTVANNIPHGIRLISGGA